jgi:hypothetical protein
MPMLTVLIYVVKAVRRTLRKFARIVSILADSFQEAQTLRRSLPHRYIEG